jgi:hypothetical protein
MVDVGPQLELGFVDGVIGPEQIEDEMSGDQGQQPEGRKRNMNQ